jgi:hypothetical protein
VVTAILTDICRAFPKLTPEIIWNEKTRTQMLIYYRAAKRQDQSQMAENAIMARMAVATAIVNTISGKDVPEFDDMVEALRGSEEEKAPAMSADIPGFVVSNTKLEDFTEFVGGDSD